MPPVISPAELQHRVRAILPGIVSFRHALHRIPEPAFEETKTARLIRERLAHTRLQLQPPRLGTDTVGVLTGAASGACVLLRADMDALPLKDQTGTPYASENPGWSHACGHDGHAAMLVGAIEVLDGLTDRFSGHVLAVFQPAEEEKGGGRELVRKGLLDADPRPDAAFALHGWPGLETGRIASKPGPFMAAQDRFIIRLIGRGGHGAFPQEAVDPIVLAAQLILALQTIPSRRVHPLRPAVLTIGTVHAGTISNVIPNDIEMTGTLRHLDPDTRDGMKTDMQRLVQGIAAANGARGECEIEPGYIATVNDPQCTEEAARCVREYLGEAAWVRAEDPSMGAEDFAYYLERVPGALLRIGVGEDHPRLHSPTFDFEDAALEKGIITLAALALETLAR